MNSKEAMQGENTVSNKNTDRAEAAAEAAAARITTRADRRFLWLWLIVATALSVAGNVGHAYLSVPVGPERIMAIAWAAAPPVLLMLAIHGLPTLARMTGAEGRDGLLTAVVWGVTLGAFGWSAVGIWEFTVGMGVPPALAVLAPLTIDLSVFGATRGLVVTAPIAARLRAGAELADTAPKRSTAAPTPSARTAPTRPNSPISAPSAPPPVHQNPAPMHSASAPLQRANTAPTPRPDALRMGAPMRSDEHLDRARSMVADGVVSIEPEKVAAVLAAVAGGASATRAAADAGVNRRTVAKIIAADVDQNQPDQPSRVLTAV